MAKKGFDLAALAREAMGDAAAVSKLDRVESIPTAEISVNGANFYEMTDLEELASSIELVGQLQPVIVKPRAEGGYTLVDGERRFRAVTEVLGRSEISCIVRTPVSDVLEELMLIEANRTQRKMTSADLSRQAERYTELLAALKESGVEIPGRLRDRVAEALQVSSTKLARLHAIRSHLEPGLLALFDDGELNESVAYELSRQPPSVQTLIYYPEMGTYSVVEMTEIFQRFATKTCALQGEKPCDHIEPRMAFCKKQKSWNRCLHGCCRDCYKRESCKTACPRIAGEVAAEKAAKKAEEKARKAAAAEEDQKKRTIADTDWARFRTLRERQGVSLDDIKAISGWFSDLAMYEDRKTTASATVKDYFNNYNGLGRLAELSDALGVTMDEVLGRVLPPVSKSDTPPGLDWQRMAPDHLPPKEGTVVCWGSKGLRVPPAGVYVGGYLDLWPEEYAWWAVIQPPKEKTDGV